MAKIYKPQEFAKLIGRSVNTLQRWDREGVLPAHRTLTNRRYYTHDQYVSALKSMAHKGLNWPTIIYIRINESDTAKNLLMQKEALEKYCTSKQMLVDLTIEDVGSALDYDRHGFTKLIDIVEAHKCQRVVIAHADRLVRFGYDWFQRYLYKHDVELINLDIARFSPLLDAQDDYNQLEILLKNETS